MHGTSGVFRRLLREIPSANFRYLFLRRINTTECGCQRFIEPLSPSKVNENVPSNITDSASVNPDLIDPQACIPLETYAPYITPAFNFAAYVNKSPTLQELVKLGVNLYVLEKRKGIPQFLLKLDFEKDMKNSIRFLHDHGVQADQLGYFITKNPLIFKEKIEDLEVRINYLQSKKFSSDMVQRIITQNPYWLMFSTNRIDRRLGHFQKTFKLTGSNVRELCTKQPRLITYNMKHIKEVTFAVKELMGFEENETKKLLLMKPRLWMMNKDMVLDRFRYVNNDMGVPHELILEMPDILASRIFRIKQRHLFLDKYCPKLPDGSNRYDPKCIGYVSLKDLVSGTDAEFCSNIARVPIDTFNAFLKSL